MTTTTNRTPFDRGSGPAFAIPAAQEPRLTERQRSYLLDIVMEKAQIKGADMGTAEASINTWLDTLTRSQASAQIDEQKAKLYELRAASRKEGRDTDLEGFWELADQRIVKVQIAVHGSGNLYGKVLDPDTGSFTYTSGVLRDVRSNGTRLTLERAKELGHLYGMCIRCGATLTDEDSIENGIGPVCAGKWV